MGAFSRVLLVASTVVFCGVSQPQTATPNSGAVGQTEAHAPYTADVLKDTTREVVVDLVATDTHDQPVSNLQPSDLAVSEIGANKKRSPQILTSVRYIPALSEPSRPANSSSLHVTLGSGCAERTTPHYELTYRVSQDEIRSGQHTISITSSRPQIHLAFGAHYFVAGTERLQNPPKQDPKVDEARLLQAACFHSTGPLSLPLVVHPVETGSAADVRYQLVLPANALELASITVNNRKLDLEYAACSFDQNGRPMHFMHSSESRTLTMSEYVQASLNGLPNFLELPATDNPAEIRFVLRDRETGNMGVILASGPDAVKQDQLTPDEARALEQWMKRVALHGKDTDDNYPPLGPIGSFGSIEARPGAMCGDVYELPVNTPQVPNFWSLDSIGSLYSYFLDLPNQQFSETGGIPGVTRATEWFGVDYHGAFYVSAPGVYQFKLVADDGAKLFIDDRLVINADHGFGLDRQTGSVTLQAGWHTIRVPYYQGPPTAVALQLFVQKPGDSLRLFDTRDFTHK